MYWGVVFRYTLTTVLFGTLVINPLNFEHIDNIIYLPGEPMGRCVATYSKEKGAGAYGYIQRLIHVCYHALCCYNPCCNTF